MSQAKKALREQAKEILDEIDAAFAKFREDGQRPVISDVTRQYIAHCLVDARELARMMGQEPSLLHHPTFLVLLKRSNDGEVVLNFLTACAPEK